MANSNESGRRKRKADDTARIPSRDPRMGMATSGTDLHSRRVGVCRCGRAPASVQVCRSTGAGGVLAAVDLQAAPRDADTRSPRRPPSRQNRRKRAS